ncbi:hypothetical protein ACFOZ7_15340 [Natribaculum luteum]|uniref:Uncharacterized protein n=1 Tax=Natribaculum luteum TaxID=1586232 RepID=A0ABD5P1V0_9EURY|nr:hypothetical protein [Natribaculum luteum]
MNSNTRLGWLIAYIIVAVSLIGGMIAVNTGSITVQRPISVTTTLLSALLTATVILLTQQQVELSRRQVEMEKRLMQFETEPSIEVVDRWFEDDDVYLKLANYGHGVAQDLKLNCILECPETDWFQPEASQTPLRRYDSTEKRVLEDTSARPQEEPVTFVAKNITTARVPKGETEPITEEFQTCFRSLISNGGGSVTVEYRITGNANVIDDFDIDRAAGDSMTVELTDLPDSPTAESVYRYQLN